MQTKFLMAGMFLIKLCGIFPIGPLYRTSNLEEKPSDLLRELPALEIMKILNFLWANLLA
jgi:hypothetical protein